MKKILMSILSLVVLSQLNLSAQKTNDKSVEKKDFILKEKLYQAMKILKRL